MVLIVHAYPVILSKPIEGGIYLSLAPDCTRAVVQWEARAAVR